MQQTRFWLMLMAMVVALHAEAPSDRIDKSPHQTKFITVNGVRLHYLDWGGNGETLPTARADGLPDYSGRRGAGQYTR
jgi:hypothetical protein